MNTAIRNEAGLAVVRICSIRGCGRVTFGGEMCDDCKAMDRQFERYFSAHQVEKRKLRRRRLCALALFGAFLLFINWLAIEAGPQIWAAFATWGK